MIENSEVKIVSDYWIEKTPVSSGYPVMVPVVDIVEIGNGGGSIAWVDEFKKLHVGPQSAGAMPGPAAYGKGGIDATTTDANLLLNRINPDYFCGCEINADVKAAENAIRVISDQLGLKANETARGIIRIANNNMTNALKLVSLNRGYDPRDFTLVAFGGGGGLHAVALAAELGIKNVIVPNGAAVFSARGMIMSDLRLDIFVTKLVELQQDSADILNELSSKIELEAVKQFEEEGVDSQQVQFRYLAKMRYQNQEHSVEVDIPDRPLTSQSIIQLEQDFHNVYEREYTYRLNTPVEIVGMHVVVMADIGKLEITKMDAGNHNVGNEQKGKRMVDYAQEGIHEATIYDGASLRAGSQFSGPAIIEDSGSTTVIHPANDVKIDEYGNIHINLGESSNG